MNISAVRNGAGYRRQPSSPSSPPTRPVVVAAATTYNTNQRRPSTTTTTGGNPNRVRPSTTNATVMRPASVVLAPVPPPRMASGMTTGGVPAPVPPPRMASGMTTGGVPEAKRRRTTGLATSSSSVGAAVSGAWGGLGGGGGGGPSFSPPVTRMPSSSSAPTTSTAATPPPPSIRGGGGGKSAAAASGFVQSKCLENTGAMNRGVCTGAWNGLPAIVKYVQQRNQFGGSIEKEIAMLNAVVKVCGVRSKGKGGCKHVVTIYEVIGGKNPGDVGIVMKLLNGGNLAEQITGDAKHPPNATHGKRRWTYIAQVHSGLRFLHGNGIVHCDIKPDNIMLHSESGKPDDAYAVITDMGIAVRKGEPIIVAAKGYGLHQSPHPAVEDQDFYALVMTAYALYDPAVIRLVEQGVSKADIDDTIRTRFPAVATEAQAFEQKVKGFRFRLAAFTTQ